MTDDLQARITTALGDQYDVEAEIGRGGMSVVYRAMDRRLRRRVAIKVLPPQFAFDPAVRERFRREAQTAAQLNHPNIIPIHSVDEKDGVAFFAMALCEGDSLALRLSRTARPPLDEARRVICEVADALAYAHARGVVHRDIKPDNILLDKDSGRALVTDFGIARAAEAGSRLTVTGIAVGTPAYMSPEQAIGEHEIDGRSDIYSLGVVGYQMLAGVTPFVANNTPSMLMKHVSELAEPLARRRPDAPPDLAAAIERALAKRPDDRWQTAMEMRDVLAGRHSPIFALRGGLGAAQSHVPVAAGRAPAAPPPPVARPLTRKELKRQRRLQKEQLRLQRRPQGELSVAERARRIRHLLVSYTGTSSLLFTINFMAEGEPWFLIPTAVMAADILRRFGGLWADGIAMGEVFRRPSRRASLEDEGSLEFLEPALPQPMMHGEVPYAEPYRMASAGAGAGFGAPPPSAPLANAPVGGLSAPPRALSPREVRDQMQAVTTLRSELEEDRQVWGSATSLERRFVKFRRTVLVAASTAAMSVGALVITALEPDLFPLVMMSTVPLALAANSVRRKVRSLRRDDVDPWDVVTQPLDTLVREYDPAALMSRVAGASPPGSNIELSPYMAAVRRATADRAAILDAVRRMPKPDRRMLPDVVPTVNALVERIASLAPTLHRLDADLRPNSLEALDARIAEAEGHAPPSAETERKVTLLRRQRVSLLDLMKRRDTLLSQLESAALLLQNLKLDLIKVRSAGVEASVQGVNNATQEARALSVEIGYVLGAAEEVRKL